ncbi:MAG: hypothetical protein M1816_004666 [Peltula sp. TS41687]|nr:MAG: hypothetical protein M1816_004666 [Peltula sp. TS41687]
MVCHGRGLKSLVENRVLPDIISGCAELAYGPNISDQSTKGKQDVILHNLIGGSSISTPQALSVLTSILHPAAPPWLRQPLSKALSVLPLRPNGVRQTIEFIASATSLEQQELGKENGYSAFKAPTAPSVPNLPLESLEKASRLLASVPSSLTPEIYYYQISDQLLTLLDGSAGSDLSRAAALIIGRIILSGRHPRSQNAAGWDVFAKPLIKVLSPTFKNGNDGSASHVLDNTKLERVLVSEDELESALTRLSTLVFSHPNPTLSKRLLGRLVLPLWALLSFTSSAMYYDWDDRALALLQAYFRVSGKVDELLRITDQFLFNGQLTSSEYMGWTFSPGSKGGVEIRARPELEAASYNLVEFNQKIEHRVEKFNKLLVVIDLNDQEIGTLFLALTRRWLKLGQESRHWLDALSEEESEGDAPLQRLIDVRLVQNLIIQWKDRLAKSPKQILELVQQLLNEYVEMIKAQQQREGSSLYRGLEHIVEKQKPDTTTTDTEASEVVSLALSLISTFLSSPEFDMSEEAMKTLSSLKSSLSFLSRNSQVPVSISQSSTHLMLLLSSMSADKPSSDNSQVPLTFDEDRKSYALALSYLSEAIVPVRAQGLSLLTDLIKASSQVIDVAATANLLISLLQDSDEFIYLRSIDALTILASKESRMVSKMLVERYIDNGKDNSVDQRLKTGEALLRVIQMLDSAFVGETASTVTNACLALAGKRNGKQERGQAHVTESSSAGYQKSRAAGSRISIKPGVNEDDMLDPTDAAVAKIVESWESQPGEDTRTRASALSIFGAALETNIATVGSSRVFSGLNLALAIISTETGEGSGILRRAAVSAIGSLLRALQKAIQEGRELGFGLADTNIEEMLRVLRYAQTTDNDGLVKENAATLIEELETWRLHILTRASLPATSDPSSNLSLAERGLAGLVVNPARNSSSRPLVEEVD